MSLNSEKTHDQVEIKVGHSPDPDDAFMFYALAKDCIETGKYSFTHQLVDIETLNHKAFEGFYELTALSLHAYAFLSDKYILCNSGASMGDNYGPMLVARKPMKREELKKGTIVVPGTLTTAFLACGMYLGGPFDYVLAPFDQILDIVEAGEILEGEHKGKKIDAGLIIHEGQLTYQEQGLHLIADMGVWWMQETGYPLPLGANGIRRDLGATAMKEVHRLLHESIQYGLEHRKEAVEYALQFGRGLDLGLADRFVGMYVNDWTLDFSQRGREAVALLLRRGYECGLIPQMVEPEFILD
ncbi:MAG: ABC transporter substrate-binding protein [Planctomycetia bacterium]|nr:ABC transporter substrate-binding protein [Planctomycetia bacterium]